MACLCRILFSAAVALLLSECATMPLRPDVPFVEERLEPTSGEPKSVSAEGMVVLHPTAVSPGGQNVDIIVGKAVQRGVFMSGVVFAVVSLTLLAFESHALVEKIMGVMACVMYISLSLVTDMTIKAVASEWVDFDPAVLVIFVELLKLTASVVLVIGIQDKRTRMPTVREVCWFVLPAILYAANNIIFFQFISGLQIATYAIFREMQVVWAAVLWYLTFRIPLGWQRWLALLGILISCTIMKIAPGKGGAVTNGQLLLGLIAPLVSTAASVATEKALKTTDLDINTQNALLYVFVAIFALLYLAFASPHRFAKPSLFFEGFSLDCLEVLVLQCILGLVISRILKRANAMLKQVLTAFRGPCLVLLILLVFQVHPTPMQGCMSGLTAISAIYYVMQGPVPSNLEPAPGRKPKTTSTGEPTLPHSDSPVAKKAASEAMFV